MKAFVFPGQGAQFVGMGKELYNNNAEAKAIFDKANEVLGFSLTDIMFEGTAEELKQTKVTQPAVFTHSYVCAKIFGADTQPNMVAGHSLGEFTALAVAGVLEFEDALRLVSERALAMQDACDVEPSTMAAILGLDDTVVEEVCAGISSGVVIPANYNCPGQVVISGSKAAIEDACIALKERGAKRALPLPVSGAFHSPFMEPARQRLAQAIAAAAFKAPKVPVYQNVDARPHTDPEEIRTNLIAQLTAPVRWTQSVQQMVADGATEFIEFGPGNVLQGLVGKIASGMATKGYS